MNEGAIQSIRMQVQGIASRLRFAYCICRRTCIMASTYLLRFISFYTYKNTRLSTWIRPHISLDKHIGCTNGTRVICWVFAMIKHFTIMVLKYSAHNSNANNNLVFILSVC